MDLFTDKEKDALAKNPFTARLLENFNSLEDMIRNLECAKSRSDHGNYLHFIDKLDKCYNTLLEKDLRDSRDSREMPDYDQCIANCVKNIVLIYRGIASTCDGIIPLIILYRYAERFLYMNHGSYTKIHKLFISALLNDQFIRPHLCNPLIMRFLFACIVYCLESIEDDTEYDTLLNAFCSDILRIGHELYWNFLEEMAERCAIYKEDLMAAAWHPRRVEKWLEAGVLDDM